MTLKTLTCELIANGCYTSSAAVTGVADTWILMHCKQIMALEISNIRELNHKVRIVTTIDTGML